MTGVGQEGGIQLRAFAPKPGRFPVGRPPERYIACEAAPMGLGAGGRMRQRIHEDPHGLDTWDTNQTAEALVHIVDSRSFREITGEDPPPTPVDAAAYTAAGLPWFEIHDEDAGDVAASNRLAGVQSISELEKGAGIDTAAVEQSLDVPAGQVVGLHPQA